MQGRKRLGFATKYKCCQKKNAFKVQCLVVPHLEKDRCKVQLTV